MDENNNKRVLNCYVAANYGGLGSLFVDLSNELSERGWNLSVVLQRLEGELLKDFSENIRVFGLGYKGPYSYLKMLYELIKLIRDVKPDIVISHSWNLNVLTVLAVKMLNYQTKLILFEHSSPMSYRQLAKGRGIIKLITIPFLYRYADALVVVSEGIKQDYVSQYSIESQKIHVIPVPVNIIAVMKKSGDYIELPWVDDDQPIIMSAGILYSLKNFPLLLEAFSIVHKERSCRLVLIGDGPDREILEKLAHKLNISDDFYILGYQSNPFKYISRASIFVLPSKYEGFGKVLVEALALGIPIISTDCSGPLDILDGGKYGLLTPNNNVKAMAKAINHLLDNPDLGNRLSYIGVLRAKKYEPKAIYDTIETLIKEL
ncbi:MAG: glycosyltransferase [Anaerolineae bacterium]|nr:glycosyltransferase [Anaerolineae bacterium]